MPATSARKPPPRGTGRRAANLFENGSDDIITLMIEDGEGFTPVTRRGQSDINIASFRAVRAGMTQRQRRTKAPQNIFQVLAEQGDTSEVEDSTEEMYDGLRLPDAGQVELRTRETHRPRKLMLVTSHEYGRGCQCGEAGCGDVPEANPAKACDEPPPGPVTDSEGCQCGEAGGRDVPQANPVKAGDDPLPGPVTDPGCQCGEAGRRDVPPACDEPLPGPVTDPTEVPCGRKPTKSGSKPIQSGTTSVSTGATGGREPIKSGSKPIQSGTTSVLTGVESTTYNKQPHIHDSSRPTEYQRCRPTEHPHIDEDLYWHAREIRVAAIENFARFKCMDERDVTHDMVYNTSAGILGWAFADVKPWDSFEPPMSTSSRGVCFDYQYEPTVAAASTHSALRREATREEKTKAVRFMVGEDNAKVLEALGALDSITDQLAIMTTDDEEPSAMGIDWVDTEIEVCLDSGCCEHVMDLQDAPGYQAFLMESAGSKHNQHFVVGDGNRIPNQGQLLLNLESEVGQGTRRL